MSDVLGHPPPFWTVVRLLLANARTRARGRARAARALKLHGAGARDWSRLFYALSFLFGLFVNLIGGWTTIEAVRAGQRIESELKGNYRYVVSNLFYVRARQAEYAARGRDDAEDIRETRLSALYKTEAERIAKARNLDPDVVAGELRDIMRTTGVASFLPLQIAAPGPRSIGRFGTTPTMLASIVLLVWSLSLVLQNEGREFDTQRRRHPMWEWLFSHPVGAGPVFMAEMLAPIAANPIYLTAPMFPALVYGAAYGLIFGVAAFFLVGAPLTIAASCLGKALEIAAMLRLPPRSRGPFVAFMSSLGFAGPMFLFVFFPLLTTMSPDLAAWLDPLKHLRWPWLGWFIGLQADGDLSFWQGVATCFVISAAIVAGSFACVVWNARKGLGGDFGAVEAPAPARARASNIFARGNPLRTKEFIWLARDRSAIVQALFLPFVLAALQLFNLRGVASHTQDEWNYLCGAAILFGTFFLVQLGPKSLASEGQALWIALTWPQGLENLLRAKARLWTLLGTGIVAAILCYAAWVFPDDIWKIGLVGLAWYFFAHSLALKSVTLASITSESGETQKIPVGRQFSVMLGTLSFAIGVFSQRWGLAVAGLVFSFATASAMWSHFRARLPFLYDPWSEVAAPAPTSVHALIAVACAVEGAAAFTGVFAAVLGADNAIIAQAAGACVSAVLMSFLTLEFLRRRAVSFGKLFYWRDENQTLPTQMVRGLGFVAMGVAMGALIGWAGHALLDAAAGTSLFGEAIEDFSDQRVNVPNFSVALFVISVLLAPAAEEFLFRGILYRTLDREWGGWRAILSSAALFAAFHPPLYWSFYLVMGAANALLFRASRSLTPAIALHMACNAAMLP